MPRKNEWPPELPKRDPNWKSLAPESFAEQKQNLEDLVELVQEETAPDPEAALDPERARKSTEFLNGRSEGWSKPAAALAGEFGTWFAGGLKEATDWYNGLDRMTKIAITATLFAGTVFTGGAPLLLHVTFGGTLFAQRFFGGLGALLKEDERLQAKGMGSTKSFALATLKTSGKRLAFSSALVGTAELIAESGWLSDIWPSSSEHLAPTHQAASQLTSEKMALPIRQDILPARLVPDIAQNIHDQNVAAEMSAVTAQAEVAAQTPEVPIGFTEAQETQILNTWQAEHAGQPFPGYTEAERILGGGEATGPPADLGHTAEAPTSIDHTQAMPAVEHQADVGTFISAHASEPHIYADAGEKHLLVLGGDPTTQADAIDKYLVGPHSSETVFGTDTSGQYRVPYLRGPDGQLTAGLPVRTGGFLGFFSHFAGPPEASECKEIIS